MAVVPAPLATLATLTRLTFANAVRQPVTWLVAGLGLVLLLLSILFGQFNFVAEDRIRLLMTAGVAINILAGLFLGVVTATAAVHDELASRTALSLFAKPVGRGQFLLGKALGSWAAAACVLVVLAIAHAIALAVVNTYGFDLQHRDFAPGPGGHEPLMAGVPWWRLAAAHTLALVNTAVLTCLAASLALRLGPVANTLICFGLFVAAHVFAGFDLSGLGIIPALHLFNLDESLQFQELRLRLDYFLLCVLYGALYSAGCLLVGLAVFNKQDIP